MLTADDEKLIVRAVVAGLAKWSLICFLVGLVVWFLVVAFQSGGEL